MKPTISQQILAKFSENSLLWGMYALPGHFRVASPRFHVEIVKAAITNRYLAVAAPRGSAKSTVLAFVSPTHDVAFQKEPFILLVQNTYQKAVRSLENIKKEFRENPYLTGFRVKLTKDSEGDSVFRHPNGFETRFLCKGAEQIGSVRGEKFGAWRPTKIIVDDLEDDELVRNPDRRRELKETYDEALIPAGDFARCRVVVVGTILHDDSLMAKLVDPDQYKEYKKITYQALSAEGRSLWEERWTPGQLREIERDNPSVFAKEYQNDPVSGRNATFEKKDFRYWSIADGNYVLYDEHSSVVGKNLLSTCRVAVGCDLAWEQKRESDYGVVMPCFLTPQSEILVDTYVCKKGLRPDEMEEILFGMDTRYKLLTGSPVVFGFEKAKLEKVMKFLMKQAMARRNHYLWFKDVSWDRDKITRITTALQPRYAQHVIYHRRGMGELEHQLLRIPYGTHDDLPDAEQICVRLLEYPKQVAKPKPADDAFERLRKFAISSRTNLRNPYSFGNKQRPSVIPTIISPLG